MFNKKINNFICNYLSEYQVQKKHIERVLSAKEITNNKKPPYYPKFLKLKLCKHQMEEEKNNKIKEENKHLFFKIINAEIKPSKYSKIYKPKICPSFNKDLIYFKRIKKEIRNNEENIRFYNKLERVKSFYENKNLTQRNKDIDNNIKKLQKSILELQPSLLFLSPHTIKRQMQKYKHLTYNNTKIKRCNSCCNREQRSKINIKQQKSSGSSSNNKIKGQINDINKNNVTLSSDSTLKKFSSLNEALSGKDNNDKNNEIIEKNINNAKDTIKKIKTKDESNNKKNAKKDKDKYSSDNKIKKKNISLDKNKIENIKDNFKENEKHKNNKIKFGLKRNTSEINLLK